MSDFDVRLAHFPDKSPYTEALSDEPKFDPAIHLALETPSRIITMEDLGYDDAIIASSGTNVAATSCFRVLSDAGVEAMYHVCRQLEAYTTSNPRIERNVRGGVYRSKFLRDFSLSQDVAVHLSGIMGTPLMPISIGHQLAHLNFPPTNIGQNVDKWHYDTLQVDTVMFVTDPNAIKGGEFQYFHGTRDEMAQLKECKEQIPSDRIIAPDLPGAGYAVLMQGNYVVHQAKALQQEGERITLVNGYSYADINIRDYTAVDQLLFVEPEGIVGAEYVRHVALRCARHMEKLVNRPDYSLTLDQQAARLEALRTEIDVAISELENAKDGEMRHFGD